MGVNTDLPPDVTPTVTLAKVYEKQGLLNKAADVYKRLIALEPDRTELVEALTDIERRLGRQKRGSLESGTKAVFSRLQRWQQGIGGQKKTRGRQLHHQRRILVIHGSRADIFRQRAPVVSSEVTLEQIDEEIRETATACSVEVDTFQSDDEGELARRIREASAEGYDAMIINPAGYTYEGAAIREALSGLDIPIIEVHVSNVHAKGNVGQKSLIADKVTAQLAGFGKEGYVMAVRAAANLPRKA
ncbi:MAG: type II 3-dehydroquinate dehydratase [Thermodesulfobacteriota bacterium]|nr:type II 3-dehydroquinate dehydratase [Thermodesulfobacteriota bacterium]